MIELVTFFLVCVLIFAHSNDKDQTLNGPLLSWMQRYWMNQWKKEGRNEWMNWWRHKEIKPKNANSVLWFQINTYNCTANSLLHLLVSLTAKRTITRKKKKKSNALCCDWRKRKHQQQHILHFSPRFALAGLGVCVDENLINVNPFVT